MSNRHPQAAREAIRRWGRTGEEAGPLLEAERWGRVRETSDPERARIALDLLSLWRPDVPGDDGEGLVRVQRAFAIWRRARA